MKRKILTLALCAALALCVLPTAAFAEGTADILVSDTSSFTVGKAGEFTVTTKVTGDLAGVMVKGSSDFTDVNGVIEKIEYYETAPGSEGWKEFAGESFGPSGGFPLTNDAASRFRITFAKPVQGVEATIQLKAVEGGAVVAEKKIAFTASAAASVGDVYYPTLEQALAAAQPGGTVELLDDVQLDEKLTVSQNVTINGNGHTISGKADDKSVFIEVTGGTFNISDVTLKDFGGNVSGASGDAVIKVPDTAAADTAVNAANVHVANFARSAYDIRSGSFAITGGTINCANSVGSTTDSKLTKGVLAGLGTNPVTGRVEEVVISNSASNYAEWDTAGIEVYNNATVSIKGGSITGTEIGIHVDNYWASNGFAAAGDAVVIVDGTKVEATDYALRTYSDASAARRAYVAINSGSFTGKIGQVDAAATDAIVINGGTFSEKPDDNFLAPGLVYENGSVVKPAPQPTAKPSGDGSSAAPAATAAPAPVLDATPKTGAVSLSLLPLAGFGLAGLGAVSRKRR